MCIIKKSMKMLLEIIELQAENVKNGWFLIFQKKIFTFTKVIQLHIRSPKYDWIVIFNVQATILKNVNTKKLMLGEFI